MLDFFRRKPAPSQPVRHPFSADGEDGPVEIEATADGVRLVGPGGESDLLYWSKLRGVRLFARLVDRRFGLPGHTLYCCALEVHEKSALVFAHAVVDAAGRATLHGASYRLLLDAIHKGILASGVSPAFATGDPPPDREPWLDDPSDPATALDYVVNKLEFAMSAPWIVTAFLGFAIVPAFQDHAPWTKLRFKHRNRADDYDPRRLPARLLPPV